MGGLAPMSQTEILGHIQRILGDLANAKGVRIGTIDESTRLLGRRSADRFARPRRACRRARGDHRARPVPGRLSSISGRSESSPDSTLNEHRSSVYSRDSEDCPFLLSEGRQVTREQVARLVESLGEDLRGGWAVVVTYTPMPRSCRGRRSLRRDVKSRLCWRTRRCARRTFESSVLGRSARRCF